MYDAMKACKPDVSTINMGLAASMGAFLLATGAKGKRLCMPNARVMIHQPMGPARGTVSAWFLLVSMDFKKFIICFLNHGIHSFVEYVLLSCNQLT